jgi:DNA-binding helix-hairpin-helix protein with protein kinase domain
LKTRQAETTRRELYKYLHAQRIAVAKIDGIDPATRGRLTAAGVKTAAEIDANRLRDFYKIDDETIPKLLDWRARLAVEFERDVQAHEAVKAAQTNFINETSRERRRIERDIEQLLILLRGGAAQSTGSAGSFSLNPKTSPNKSLRRKAICARSAATRPR